jgi:hypothetical protein
LFAGSDHGTDHGRSDSWGTNSCDADNRRAHRNSGARFGELPLRG